MTQQHPEIGAAEIFQDVTIYIYIHLAGRFTTNGMRNLLLVVVLYICANAEAYNEQSKFSFPLDASAVNAACDYHTKVESAKCAIQWALDTFGDTLVASTSFGIQSAVLLHLFSRFQRNISVIWVSKW